MKKFSTRCGEIIPNEKENAYEFLGVPFAKAKRFKYAEEVTCFPEVVDATKYGDACTQKRTYFEHLEHPERKFYHREFRENIVFNYSEDCLNLNIWTPKKEGKYPVVIFIHGGGFDSGATSESSFDGEVYAKNDVIMVTIQYRVGVFGYLTNDTLEKENGRDGNFGLDDILVAIKWVKHNIEDYYGDKDNITLMGQSAGAISIQYLCLNKDNEGLFNRVIMMSGGGMFPKFALPRDHKRTQEYWDEVISLAGCKDIEEFKKVDSKTIFEALEVQKSRRKDNTYNTMPVIDGVLLKDKVDVLIKNPIKVDYMIGYTNNDMYALIMSFIGTKFAMHNNGYVYYFNQNAKGDKNKAFHSSDLRYAFDTLDKSWRPYDESDYELSKIMIKYFTNFIKTGNPNDENLAKWKRLTSNPFRFKKAMQFSKKVKMVHPSKIKLLHNTLFGGIK